MVGVLASDYRVLADGLPQFTLRELVRNRRNEELPEGHELRTHYGTTIKV